jgi:hypothetical protein
MRHDFQRNVQSLFNRFGTPLHDRSSRPAQHYPIMLLANFAVLVVKPAGKTRSSESRRISGETGLNTAQRQTALSD